MVDLTGSVFGKGRIAAMERGDQKRLATYKWLYQFNVSTQRLLAGMLKVDERGQHQFFSRLQTSGFVESFLHPALGRERLFRLTRSGYEIAASQLGYSDSRPAQISPAVLLHDLTVQKLVVQRLSISSDGQELPLLDFTSERHNGAPLNGKKPDVLLDYGARKISLELELTHKNTARVYYNLLAHLYNIRDEHYTNVHYVFTSDRLCALYQEKFAAPDWPVYRVGQGRNRLEKTPSVFNPQPRHHLLFNFTVEKGYFV